MRLALTKNKNRSGDIFCDEASHAKRKLQREPITQLSIDHYLNGRENGYQFICWALGRSVMPLHIVLTESHLERREAIAKLLIKSGYRSGDEINFMKYS